MALLAIVDPAEWIKRTTLTFSRTRSPSLKAADDAYTAYFRTRSQSDMKRLHDALGAYLREKGGHWEKVDRNKKSDGLMRFIYEHTASSMPTGNVLSKRIPESRHGVVYLWSNANVETQWALIFLEGAFNIGGAANTMFGEDGLNMVPKNLSPLGTTAGIVGAVGGIGSGMGRSLRTGQEVEVEKPKSSTNYRHGAIKLTDVDAEPTNFERFKSFLGRAWDIVYAKIKELVLFIKDKIVMTFTGGAATIVGAVSKVIEKVVLMIIKEVCKAAMPFVGAGIDIARGVSQAVVGIKDRVQAYLSRRHFIVSPGHPALIVNSIETQMNWNIAKGLYNACKGGAKVAGNVFTAGASAIIDVIAAGFEFAVRLIQRIGEAACMKQWVNGVKSICGNRNSWKADPKDGVWRPAICYDDKWFIRLFELGCESSVCVPMLTLNSGICGDQMMFMKMFDDTSDQNVISQKSFDTATGYFTRLKVMGREYVQNSGFRFTSALKDVQGYFWHAVTHHETKPTKGELAQKFFTG